MLRLCFERLPGHLPIDAGDDFVQWFETNFEGVEYRYGGYVVRDLGEMWFGRNVLWTVLMDTNVDVLARVERQGWVVDGYAVHAYFREVGQNEVKIANNGFKISREAAEALVAA